MIFLKNNLCHSIILIFIVSCSSEGSVENLTNDNQSISINVNGLITPSASYAKQTVEISTDNSMCSFNIVLKDNNKKIHHVKSNDNKTFSFRNPIVYRNSESHFLVISTNLSNTCPQVSKEINLEVLKSSTKYDLIPENVDSLKTKIYAINDIGFEGIIIRERYSATICYPTENDCKFYENELFGQDAHNMVQGDFNGDGHEDFAVAWAFFPHTIEADQKVYAPLNIYLSDGNGSFEEQMNIYKSGNPTKHPFAYRTIAADFNNDGVDDIFSGSMGIQYRSSDYSQNYIDPYPHLLLISDGQGSLEDKSEQIEDFNDGNGQLCGFAHDASVGDPDGDGDLDIFACNILNINDGNGNFKIHDYINLNWQRENQYGNPMSSILNDLNNDNFDDIVFWNFDNRESWSSADEGYILLSNGTPIIRDWAKITLPAGPYGYNKNKYNHAVSGDLNSDGYQDVVVAITRDQPYYEGAYLQILINDGNGNLIDMTDEKFSEQPRSETHHGEGNLYLRDMNLDGYLDIIHSTRDYSSGYHGAHIAINDGKGSFNSIANSMLPDRPDPGSNNYDYLMKSLPINIDNEGCIDFISVTDVGWENSQNETSNYFFSVINTDCNF